MACRISRFQNGGSFQLKKISHAISTVELIPWKLRHCPITNQEY